MPESNMFKLIPITKFECITEKYPEDANNLFKLLQSFSDKVTIHEYYPFWSYLSYTAIISYENIEILRISHYNKKCIPIHEVPALIFGNKITKLDDMIKIVSFDRQLLMNMIWGLRARVNENEADVTYHNVMTSHLIEIRKYYFDKTKKTILDLGLFQQFITSCFGKIIHPERELRITRNKKAKEGKLIIYTYRPEDKFKTAETTYSFPNVSGNEIRNVKNLHIATSASSTLMTNDNKEQDNIDDIN